jgi:glycosyltransferase involved in cell wall biosynthesis
MPKISVIIPAYNSANTILETIASVQQQTESDFELIVINDGSTDNTLELLETIKDCRLKVFSYTNKGLPVARNRGIANSNGEFISFIDADDLWSEDKLELQLQALLSNPKAGVAYSWTMVMDEKGESFFPGTLVSHQGDVGKQLLSNNFIASGSNVMLRRSLVESIGEFDPTLKSAEDWDYWLRIALRGNQFVVVPKAQIFYRQSSGAMSSKIEVMEKYNLMVVDRACQIAPPELQYLKKESQAYVYLHIAQLSLLHDRQIKQTFQKLSKAFILFPQIATKKKFVVMSIKLLITLILPMKLKNEIIRTYHQLQANNYPVFRLSVRSKI